MRTFLRAAVEQVREVYPRIELLDLRDITLPIFDGRAPEVTEDPNVQTLLEQVRRADGLVVGAPAYWSAVAAGFKNLIEVLCGPAYDQPINHATVFKDKAVGLFIVGADLASAVRGYAQSLDILTHVGATVVTEPVIVANPRDAELPNHAILSQLVGLIAEVVRHVVLTRD